MAVSAAPLPPPPSLDQIVVMGKNLYHFCFLNSYCHVLGMIAFHWGS